MVAKSKQQADVVAEKTEVYDKTHDYGHGMRKYEHNPPEVAGAISAYEASEIKRRNLLIGRLEVDEAHSRQLLAMARNEKFQFMRSIARRFGVDDLKEFNINDETGQLFVTAHAEFVTPDELVVETVEETPPALAVVPDEKTEGEPTEGPPAE